VKSAKFRAALLDVIAESGAAAGNCTKAKANLLYNIAAKVRAACCEPLLPAAAAAAPHQRAGAPPAAGVLRDGR